MKYYLYIIAKLQYADLRQVSVDGKRSGDSFDEAAYMHVPVVQVSNNDAG